MTPSIDIPDPSLCDTAAVVVALGTDSEAGLAGPEAARRLAQDGPNELRAAIPRSGWRRALAQLRDPLVYLLLVAAVVTLLAWALEGRHGTPMDAIVITVVVVLNAVLGWVQESRAASAVAALAGMAAVTSAVVRDGQMKRVPSAELVRGDVLVLAEGDAVGADARIFQCASLRVLEASLTGESEAVTKDAATLPAAVALGDRTNMVFRGTAVAQGSARALVTATGMQSELGAIATLLDATADAPTPLQQEIARLGRMMGVAAAVIAVVVVGTIFVISGVRSSSEVMPVLLLGVSLAVATVPEGLPAILSVVLAMGVQRMARRRAIVKKLASVETLGSASVIATDKTGTLTRAEMTIVRVSCVSGAAEVTGAGYVPEGRIEHGGEAVTTGPLHEEIAALLGGGSLAGNAELRQDGQGAWEVQGDPTDAAFLVAERKLEPAGHAARRARRFSRLREIPFTSERKMMSSVEVDRDTDSRHVVFTKGAPGELLARCSRARVGSATVELDAGLRDRILADVDAMAGAALRTLSVASRAVDPQQSASVAPAVDASIEHDLTYLGTVGMIDPPRTEVSRAIEVAHRAGIRVIMITGDHPRTALRIAIDLGIVADGARVLTGIELDALAGDALQSAVIETSVFARVAPKHKLLIVRILQAAGHVVAMTGDGVNDAPALKAADIGVAMGVTGTEVARGAARMILADDNFATIVEAVREGRGVLDNIRKFLRYLLSSNLGEVLTVFFGIVGAGVIGLGGGAPGSGAVVLPLLATQILWINLITDTGPALAMGVDPVADDVMSRRPRRPDERMIGMHMWFNVFETGVVMAFVTLLTMDMCLPGGLVEGSHDLAYARTAGFTVLVLAQLFNCLNARSGTASAFRALFANRWLWGAILLSVLLQLAVVHMPFLNRAFSTVPLSAGDWLVCVALASGVLWFAELRKLLRRASGSAPHSGSAQR